MERKKWNEKWNNKRNNNTNSKRKTTPRHIKPNTFLKNVKKHQQSITEETLSTVKYVYWLKWFYIFYFICLFFHFILLLYYLLYILLPFYFVYAVISYKVLFHIFSVISIIIYYTSLFIKKTLLNNFINLQDYKL